MRLSADGMQLTREQIIAEIEKLGPWWHALDLGNGIKIPSSSKTDPDHPRRLWEAVKKYLPVNLEGKSVMDPGCNAGFFCIAAKKEGPKG